MSEKLLDAIASPEDLKRLSPEEIPALCEEIRAFLVETVKKTGGHLSSNLGAVELTVAMHRVFSSPADHILFDVGHQSYVHKILTGRRAEMDALRAPGGLSGFTLRRESPHDPFGAGHSSTALSAALGLAEADRMEGKKNCTVVLMGDGAYTGGMVHEAFNNLRPDSRLIVILNENRMSISRTRGRFASYLSRVRISKSYLRWKRSAKSFLSRLPLLGKPLYRFLSAVKDRLKAAFYSENYFEQLGFYYVGPVDGNRYSAVERALTEARRLVDAGRPVLVHAFTVKGRGYEPAERSPEAFHNIAPAGAREPSRPFHALMAEELISLAGEDGDVLAITAAMGHGTGLSAFERAFPERFYDVGIAEPHALTFAAGLAAGGKKPYVAIYSTFLQRGYDQILHDIALQGLPVRILVDRAGLAVHDGATHHGIYDVSFLSGVSGLRILTPATEEDLRRAMRFSLGYGGPIVIRYPNAEEDARLSRVLCSRVGDPPLLRASFAAGSAPACVIVTYSGLAGRALDACKLLGARGVPCGIVLLGQLAPYAETAEALLPYLNGAGRILFAEEGVRAGGAGMMICDALSRRDPALAARVDIAAIEDGAASPSSPSDLYEFFGLSAGRLADRLSPRNPAAGRENGGTEFSE